jgi:NAD(P)-dependent dehydrogenase (short-subunit alcohol dehydrogenase family)
MEFNDKIAVVTGGASGIGLAIAERFVREGATVVISDINEKLLNEKAAQIKATPIPANVAVEDDIKNLVEKVTERFGRVDIFVSNAGVAKFGGIESSEAEWDFTWKVNVMSQVFAAKYLIPQMVERGSGYLINVASAAGLLVEFHSVLYSTSKHACIGLAEWLAATYKEAGIDISVVCPGPVRTPMAAGVAAMQEDALEPEELVDIIIKGISNKQFMISSHEKIWKLYEVKSRDYNEYIDLLVKRRSYKLGLDEK